MTVADVTMHDRYPTRMGQRPEFLDRTDPTVWPGIQAGPAGAGELALHDANGFHIVDAMLSGPEVERYRGELDRLTRDEDVRSDERTVVEPSSEQVRSIFDVHRTSEVIARLTRDPRLLDRARQILGSDVYVHQSRINYMPGFEGNGFYWHSDFETWHAEDGMPAMRAVSVSIALTENYPFNGGLMIVPNSHRTFVSCVGETPDANYKESLRDQKVGVPDRESVSALAYVNGIEQFTGSAGSALWFDSNCLHGSSNNITPFPRSNIFIVFNSVDNALVEPFSAPTRRPEFVASRTFAPLTR